MKASEIREMTDDQLEEKLVELHRELRDLRFQEAVGQMTNTARPRQIRKDIARIHTVRTEMANQAAE
ncbi:MAG TPA: 50S ribosomal protein L29 [Thermomicrobiales bacterium]|jgi:large subunit ribosomal protein L29|nr:50S ribosomal protein L29 [Thermomicrobiales bacterium]